mgnify:FL=1
MMNQARIFFAVTATFLLLIVVFAETSGYTVTDGAWWMVMALNAVSTLFLYFTEREKEPVYGTDSQKAAEVCCRS